MTFGLQDLHEYLGEYEVVGRHDFSFSRVAPIDNADGDSLVWLRPTLPDKRVRVEQTKAAVVICAAGDELADRECTFLLVADPRLAFLRVTQALFQPAPAYGIHQTAHIAVGAIVHPESSVGPFVSLGRCRVGRGTRIDAHCVIADNVSIGDDVVIKAGAVIGGEGFGFARTETGEMELFPHVGGVRIENDVYIGANTCIDRGTLGDTVIKEGAKIDNLVHVAHNVTIGRHAVVIANSLIGGSTVVGDYAWVAPTVTVRDGVSLGDRSTVGLGAVVTKSIPGGETWAGSPARPLKELQALQTKLTAMIRDEG